MFDLSAQGEPVEKGKWQLTEVFFWEILWTDGALSAKQSVDKKRDMTL